MITNSLVAWSDDSKTMAVWHGGMPIYACEFRSLFGTVQELDRRSCGYRLPMPGSGSRATTVAHLLTNGFSVQEFFCRAASEGDTSALKLLHDFGGDLNGINMSGYSPLWLAVMHSHESATAVLLNMGANPNPRTERTGMTPLMSAAVSGKENLVRLLLAHRADKRLVDKEGKTAADFAKMAHREQIARLIETY